MYPPFGILPRLVELQEGPDCIRVSIGDTIVSFGVSVSRVHLFFQSL